MPESYGTFALVLHSHLPYVLMHDRLEEEWLFEAVVESYLPLLQAFYRLVWQGVSPRVTVGVTPVLLEQIADSRFAPRLLAYLEQKSHAAREDQAFFRRNSEPAQERLARLWEEFYRRTSLFFREDLSSDIIGAFRRLQKQGHLELIASAATHAYLPLLGFDASVQAQVALGVRCYQRHFRARPRGFWLPECAYRPAAYWTPPMDGMAGLKPTARAGVDQILASVGLRYFFVDARQLAGSSLGYPRHSPCRLYTLTHKEEENSFPMAIFSRDFETTARVWQHDSGYPGDPLYLEFHKKQGEGGLRYWRITDRRTTLAYKQPYMPELAFAQVNTNVTQFVQVLRERLLGHWRRTGERGIVVAAFDTELFGHWWFEGPQWVSELLRQLATVPEVRVTTCSEYLDEHPPRQTIQLQESSWGDGGDHRVWWQSSTQRLWRNQYQAECDMQDLNKRLKTARLDDRLVCLLRQCGRELLLLQSSDWPFMIGTRSTPDHAQQRVALHYENFQCCRRVIEQYVNNETIVEEDWRRFATMEQQDALFSDLDPHVFGEKSEAPIV